MKPHGAIPRWWDAGRIEQALAAAGAGAGAGAAAGAQTPCFVYDFAIIADRITTLRAALPPTVGIHYAVKANPLPQLVAAVAPLVDGLDIASGGELALVANYAPGVPVSFAGPGKRDVEIAAAIAAGVTLNLESEGEAARAIAAGARLGMRPRLAVRVNPDFAIKGSGMRMGGGAAAFGIDADRVPDVVRSLIAAGVDWRGFHIFAGSQALDTDALIETQSATLGLAGALADAIGMAPPLVNIGGGFGLPYFAGDATVDVDRIGAALAHALANRPASLTDSRFVVELGRWIVGECGVYLTRIVDRKASRGQVFLITDGGLHHQLAASGNFGTVVRRNYPIAIATRLGDGPCEVVNVVGCLCTPLDKLGNAVLLPVADVGDVVAVFMAGAYGATASPAAFLGHGPAREVLIGAPLS